MGILDSLNPIGIVLNTVSSIVGKIWPDKTEQEKEQFLLELQNQLDTTQLANAQIQVDNQEAQNPNVWVSGARPFIMWVCGCSFAWQFLLQPIITYILMISGHSPIQLPVFDYTSLNTILMGMLGLGAMRSYEKVRGVNNNHQ